MCIRDRFSVVASTTKNLRGGGGGRGGRRRRRKEEEEEVLFDRMAEDESAQRSRKPAHDKQPLECNPISSIFIFEFNIFEKSKNEIDF